MASEEEQEQQRGARRGFAGLSSMVTKVDTTVGPVEQSPSRQSSDHNSDGHTHLPPHPKVTIEPRQEEPPHPSVHPYVSPSDGKLLLGIAAIIGCIWIYIWLVSESSNNRTPSVPNQFPNRSADSAPALWPIPQSPQTTVRSQASSRPSEEKPPVGTNLVLESAQLRYCVAENIRLDSAKGALNETIESDIARFNGMVTDYNSHCGEFRYRRGTLESAKSEVERYRAQLQSEGRSRFSQIPSERSRPDPIENSKLENLDSTDSSMGAVREHSEMSAEASDLSNHAAQILATETSRDTANFRECISGKNPSLCNHSILMPSEAIQVDRAERRANFEMCIDGRYPPLCNHSLLTTNQALRVDASEKDANFETCMDGRSSPLCNHSLLMEDQVAQVKQAEQKANLAECISGKYPALCDHSLLTPDQVERVVQIEIRVGRDKKASLGQ